MKGHLGCMTLTHEYVLMHFLLKNNVSYGSEVMELWLYDDDVI